MRLPSNPIGFDSTVLINFGECGSLDALVATTRPPRYVMAQVRQELISAATRDAVDRRIGSGHLTPADLQPAELPLWARLAQRLGTGESATMAAAACRGWTVACDDRAARRIATRELGDGRVIGTVGILVCAVTAGVLDRAEARLLLRRMVAAGYWSPVDDLPDDGP